MVPYSNTHAVMVRSVAVVSESWTCSLSSPKNESGIHSSGGIFDRREDGTIKVDAFVHRGTRCSSGPLRTRTSSSCGTWSAPNTWSGTGLLVTTHAASGAEGIRSDSAGDGTSPNTPSLGEREDVAAGVSTGSGPVCRCHDRWLSALWERYTLHTS
jgi:hypothetical protein